MADMRLFHHFLITAYPHLPVGADKVWITVIPSFAHNVGPCSFSKGGNLSDSNTIELQADAHSTNTSSIPFWHYLHLTWMP